MNPTEDRLRSAAQAAAGIVAPGSAPPLHLPGQPGRRLGIPRPPHRGGWPRWVAPLAAATAVIAVIAGSLAVTSGTGARTHAPKTAAERAAIASVPPYYLALTGYAGQRHHYAVVRASATGAALATVTPPRPYGTFTHVSGAADDRTFVVAVQRWVPMPSSGNDAAAKRLDNSARAKFFLLRFNPVARTARLTALPVPGEPGGEVGESSSGLAGMALSPDGSKLAIAIQRPAPLPPEIKVANVATGSEQTWVWQGPGWIDDFMETYQPLSWAADGRTLAFQQGHGFTTTGVRLLDTDSPGGNLRSLSRPAAQWQFAEDNAGNIAITPDGSKIIAPVNTDLRHPLRADLQIREFSATTGKVLSVAGHWRYIGGAEGEDVLWTNSSGSTLIVVAPDTSPFGHLHLRDPQWAVGVLTGDQFTPLPGAFAHDTNEIVW
jgi:hypothetical protein